MKSLITAIFTLLFLSTSAFAVESSQKERFQFLEDYAEGYTELYSKVVGVSPSNKLLAEVRTELFNMFGRIDENGEINYSDIINMKSNSLSSKSKGLLNNSSFLYLASKGSLWKLEKEIRQKYKN